MQAGSGGGRDVYGDWTNEGTVDVEPGAGLNLQGGAAGGPDFTQAGGSLTVAGGGRVVRSGACSTTPAAPMPAEVVAFNSQLDIAAA